MAQSKANCKFCSRTDNSIQVICETRCLICSRCQLMPGIRKLLIDHSNSDGGQNTHSGCCPICESPISPSMLSLIATFKESFRKIQTDDIGGKLGSEIELEEVSTIISSFLKRFRNTYEIGADGKVSTIDKDNKDNTGGNNGEKTRFHASVGDIYDVYSVPQKATPPAVAEFIVECYHAQWQCVLRNSNESMVSIVMRLTNRKKFSQRTNDFKAKSLIDFMMAATGGETPDFLLFGRLLGIQPRLTNNISTAWSQIAISVIVASHMERCLKFGMLNDVAGNPTASELRTKLIKSGAGPISVPKSVTLKKAIKIISLLSQVQHPYWTMSPLAPACIEYNCKLPWRDDSIAKLLNVLFFVAIFEPSSAPPSAPTTAGTNRRGSTMNSLPTISNNNTNPGTPQTGRSHSNLLVAPKAHETVERTASSRSLKPSDKTDGVAAAPQGTTTDLPAFRLSMKAQMLKNLDAVTKRVWGGQMQSTLSENGDKTELLDFFARLDQNKFASPGYVRLTYEKAISLSEGISILVSELALVLIECWEEEYAEIKVAMSRGKLTSKRRMGISGNYDTTQAKLTAVERLALTRLLHWYSVEGESRGVDWEDVDQKFQERLFPFTVPSSLMAKSRNELDYLAGTVWKEVKTQMDRDVQADTVAEDGPYSTHNRGVRNGGTSSLVYHDSAEERSENDYVTMEEIERYNREQYLASQSLGYEGDDFSGYCDLQERDLAEDEAHKHKQHRSNSAYVSHFTNKQVLRRANSSGPLHVLERDSEDIMHRTASLSAVGGGRISVGGMNRDTMSPMTGESAFPRATSAGRPKTPLSRLPYESPAPGPHNVNMVDVLGVGGNVLTNAKLLANKSQLPPPAGKNTRQREQPLIHQSGVPTTPLEHEVHNMRILDAVVPGQTYDEVHDAHEKARVLAARSRIRQRIDIKLSDVHGAMNRDTPVTDGTVMPSYLTNNCRVTQVLELSEFVNRFGAFTVDLTTHLTAETIVKYFSLRNTSITSKSFQYVVDHYLKPWQLDKMVRIDIDGNSSLGIPGAKILGAKLSACCRLVHLNVSGLGMGDTGLRHLLKAIVQGGGQTHLLRLDVSANNITMVSDSISQLGQLDKLRALDISKNCFTLDTKIQRKYFAEAVAPLSSLQSLSVAYNKIQHDGFELIVGLVSEHLLSLRQLDLASCFISSRSYSTLITLLELTREISTGLNTKVARLEEVMFQDNLFSYAQIQELHAAYDARADIKVVLSAPHLGIQYPLRYDLKDYGIDSYLT